MKTTEPSRWLWIIAALAACICFILCPWCGWYGLTVLMVIAAGCYIDGQLAAGIKRRNENADVLSRLSRKQRESYAKLEVQQQKNLKGLITIAMPFLMIGTSAINVYAAVYNLQKNKEAAVFDGAFFQNAGWAFCIAGVVLLLASLFLFEKQARRKLIWS